MLARAKPLSGFARATPFRLMAAFAALFVAVAAAIAWTLVWQTNELLTRQLLSAITSEAEGFRSLARLQGSEAVAAAVAERSRASSDSLYFLSDRAGSKISGNLNRWPPELGPGVGGLFHYATGEPGATQRMAVGIPVALEDGQRLLVSRDVEEQRQFIARVRDIFLAGFGFLVLVGLAGAIAASRLILKRIADITAASESIMAGDLSRRIALSGSGDELDELGRKLNDMLDRIEQLMASLREVSDNIAHDLKTPLNRLRNRAEAALRDGQNAVDYQQGLERTIEEADELIKTFNAMLLIARLEAGAVEESVENFDIAGLVRDVVELYEPHAEENHCRLRLQADEILQVRGNRQLIGQAVANLVDNAIKYGARPPPCSGGAPADCEIEVALRRAGQFVEIAVADHGPGIPALDRDRALKRFVRLEASRTRPGTGLGLSLVAAVAHLHKGSVRLEDNEPGLRVVLSWPAPAVV